MAAIKAMKPPKAVLPIFKNVQKIKVRDGLELFTEA
jgi:hypothetical protein